MRHVVVHVLDRKFVLLRMCVLAVCFCARFVCVILDSAGELALGLWGRVRGTYAGIIIPSFLVPMHVTHTSIVHEPVHHPADT